MLENIPNDWKNALKAEFGKPYFSHLSQQVSQAYQHQTVFPPAHQIFAALDLCPLEKVKVVILGQDPYHGLNQAHGLSFSVQKGIRQPASLKNIFKELVNDHPGFMIPGHGNLEDWAKQGVLLLNAILTVQQAEPGSHKNFGWENFTDAIIQTLSDQKNNLVFMLWGNYALTKNKLIDENKHLVLKAAHPSPLARGAFFGSKHFSKANNYLVSKGLEPIEWRIS